MAALGSFCRRPLDRVQSNAPENGSLEGHGASDIDGTITAHDPSDLTHHAGPVGQQAESVPDETPSWPRSRLDATDLHLTFESSTRHEGDLAAPGIAALESPRAGDHSEAGYRCPSKCACADFYYDADDERDEEDEDGDGSDDEDGVYDPPAVFIIHQGGSGAIPSSSCPALHKPNNALFSSFFASRHDSPASSTLRAWFDLPSPGAPACGPPWVVAASRDEEVRIGIVDDDDDAASSTADDRSALTYYTDTAYDDNDDDDEDEEDEEHVFRWRGDLVTAAKLADAAAVVELELEMGLLADGLARRLLQGSSSGGGDSSWSLSSWSLSGGSDESRSRGSGSSDADSVWDADG